MIEWANEHPDRAAIRIAELGKLKTENQIMRNRLKSVASDNNKQTDEYICVDREHGLWKRKEPKEPNVNADRLALALSLETIQELEAENAALKAKVEVIVKNYEDYKAENAALRVALEDIMTESDEQVIWRMARAALERKEAQP